MAESDSDDFELDDKIFGLTSEAESSINRRKSIRYIRDDIQTYLIKTGLFAQKKQIPVKLLDISTKGIGLELYPNQTLSLNKKLTVLLEFGKHKTFTITAQAVHKIAGHDHQYGIKFDKTRHDLGDYLLDSQNDLIFK